MARKVQITFDCADVDAMAAFWAEVLGYHVQPPPPGFDSWPAFFEANDIEPPDDASISAIVDPDGDGPRVLFLRVPEGKTAKNRVHLDVVVSERGASEADNRAAIAARVPELVALGARKIADFDESGSIWTVMHDPEGNEFCLV